MKKEKAIGILFISIALGIFISAVLAIFIDSIMPLIIILPLSLVIAFRNGDLRSTLKEILSNSNRWGNKMRLINGLAWALPFILAIIIPSYYPYLILLGIGLGNITTYLMIKVSNGFTTRGQMIVGITALSSLPLIAYTYYLGFDGAVIMRFLIAIAYGVGGLTNIMDSPN